MSGSGASGSRRSNCGQTAGVATGARTGSPACREDATASRQSASRSPTRSGSPPDSSFDAAVRAAGSILLAQVRRGRRCILALNTAQREMQAVSSDGPEWQRALELLAAAEPDARNPVATLLRSADAPASRSLELVVVTSRVEPALVDRLLERALTRRPVALVHVEAESFVGRPHRPVPELLRLQAAGVPIAVVRHGNDLAVVLGGASVPE